MTTVLVFDPAMCCSTGVCGPSVDPQLTRFAADLEWLKTSGVSVERFNLAQQPAAFAADPAVRSALETRGEAALPLLKVDGAVKSSGVYPTRAELAALAGVSGPSTGSEDAVRASRPIMLKVAASACCDPGSEAHKTDPVSGGSSSCC